MRYTTPAQPMGFLSVTTGSSYADKAITWGFWIGMGLVAHRLYRVARYGDPFFQFGGGVPAAWEMNPEAEEFDRVCAYCKRMWFEGKWVPGEPTSEWVTHGICDKCEVILLREIEELEREEGLK